MNSCISNLYILAKTEIIEQYKLFPSDFSIECGFGTFYMSDLYNMYIHFIEDYFKEFGFFYFGDFSGWLRFQIET